MCFLRSTTPAGHGPSAGRRAGLGVRRRSGVRADVPVAGARPGRDPGRRRRAGPLRTPSAGRAHDVVHTAHLVRNAWSYVDGSGAVGVYPCTRTPKSSTTVSPGWMTRSPGFVARVGAVGAPKRPRVKSTCECAHPDSQQPAPDAVGQQAPFTVVESMPRSSATRDHRCFLATRNRLASQQPTATTG
jgi:hypothetical protein